MCGVVEYTAGATHGRATLVAEERQRLARMHRTPGRPADRRLDRRYGSSGTADGQRRGRRRRREGDDSVTSEVAHLAVRTLARGADRILAGRTPGHQLHHGRVTPTAPTTHPGLPRSIQRRPGGRQARRTADVRASRSRARQLIMTRTTERVETW